MDSRSAHSSDSVLAEAAKLSQTSAPGASDASRPQDVRGSAPHRRSRAWRLVLALVVAVTVVGGIPYAIAARDARRPVIEERPIRLELPANVTLESLTTARVLEVTSGNTLTVALDGREVSVRYLGVVTPARGRKCYREAKDRNELLVGNSLFTTKKVHLLGDDALDAGGFLPRYVFNEDGISINATLVAEGFAEAAPEGPLYGAQFTQLQEEAVSSGLGCLWK